MPRPTRSRPGGPAAAGRRARHVRHFPVHLTRLHCTVGVVAIGALSIGVLVTRGKRRMPGPVRWLLYAYGRGLPAEYREWVLHDLTTRTWALRQLLRSLVQALTLAIPV